MSSTPAFLDPGRPDVPDIVVPRAVLPFYIPNRPVRGRLVRLGALADALITRHEQHPSVHALVGQAMALTAALATALKYRGSFSLQAKGDGAVPMLLADCTEDGTLRGYARANDEKLASLLNTVPNPDAAMLLGRGYLAFSVDQGPDMERHQGIVAIIGENLAAMAMHYFETSEQLPCVVKLACAHTEQGWRASALVLERIAGAGGVDPSMTLSEQNDHWHTAVTLASTLTDAELLDESLSGEQLLFRLFHGEGVAADRPRALAYGCRCSRAKLSGILEGFSGADLDEMVLDDAIVMNCEFCNIAFRFARDEVRGLDQSDQDMSE